MDTVLSLVVPAYNEAKRLPPFLKAVRRYLDRQFPNQYEVIVVDDGSRDGTAGVVESLAVGWPELTLTRHPRNRGKGAAVRTGMLAARGERLLFADADGATPIEEEAKLAQAIDHGADLAIGSRLLPGEGVQRRRTPARALIGRAFARFARWWLGIPIADTQCGFKMFRRQPGRELFGACEETGYLFDLELLARAQRLGHRVAEVPIHWSDIPGGHLSVRRDLPRILLALARLRRRLRAESGKHVG